MEWLLWNNLHGIMVVIFYSEGWMIESITSNIIKWQLNCNSLKLSPISRAILATLFRPFDYLRLKTMKLFGFPIFCLWTCMMKVIPWRLLHEGYSMKVTTWPWITWHFKLLWVLCHNDNFVYKSQHRQYRLDSYSSTN
jgi:hypothetical protein